MPDLRVSAERQIDRRNQRLLLNWFQQNVDSAGLHRQHARLNGGVPGQKYDRSTVRALREHSLQLEPAAYRHVQVEQQTPRGLRINLIQKCQR